MAKFPSFGCEQSCCQEEKLGFDFRFYVPKWAKNKRIIFSQLKEEVE